MSFKGTSKDLFSGHAADYARFRPRYPAALIDLVSEFAPDRRLAWDCGTGNGQAAVELAKRFDHVIATDPSSEQIAKAERGERIEYRVMPAEKTSLASASVSATTVAQALHWFDHERFGEELIRVSAPGAILAVWSYSLARIAPAVDAVTWRLYDEVLGKYWEPERRHVDEGYARISLPLTDERRPQIEMTAEMKLADWLGYLGTWSALKSMHIEQRRDPLIEMRAEFERAWGTASEAKRVSWPLTVRLGKIKKAAIS